MENLRMKIAIWFYLHLPSVMLFWFLIWLLPSSLVCTQLYEDNTIVRRFPVFSIALLMSHVQTKIPQRTDGRAGRLLGDRSFSTDSAVQSCGCSSYYHSSGVNAHLQIHTSTLMLTSCLGSSMKKSLFWMLVERLCIVVLTTLEGCYTEGSLSDR